MAISTSSRLGASSKSQRSEAKVEVFIKYFRSLSTRIRKEDKLSNNEKKHLVFTYGTLKGMDRQRMKTAVFKGRGVTLFDHFLMWGGGFPVVISSVLEGAGTHPLHGTMNGQVQGELFEVDDDALKALDNYEGAPEYYESIPVALKMEDGTDAVALMYVGTGVQSSIPQRPIIKPSSGMLYWPYPAEHRPEPL